MGTVTLQSDIAQVTLMRVLMSLEDGPLTMIELARAVPISERWCKVYVDELRRMRAVRVCKWERAEHGKPMYWLELGSEPDARRMKAQSQVEKTAAYRKRLQKSGELDHVLARRRALRNAETASKQPHGWAASIGV